MTAAGDRRAQLSAAQARRIALAAQGLAAARGLGTTAKTPNHSHLGRVVARTKLIQMDSVNILARAHYLPMFSRVGAYDTELISTAAWQPGRRRRTLVEYWAHEAALIPIEDWSLFGWRMREFAQGRYRYTREVMRRNRSLADDVRDVIAAAGASTPRDIEEALGIVREPGRAGSWWERGEVKHVCEALFASGELSAVRNGNFLRHYDLSERVLGAAIDNPEVSRVDAHRELTRRAADALGIATAADLADYYRTKLADVRPAIADLVEEGELIPVTVAGWRDEAYLHRAAAAPRRAERSTLLSPFDPLVFYRPRTQRLFDFHYRIEIYVPASKRVHGYYVLPYLLGEHLVARVDLKADRTTGTLHVPGAFLEDGQAADTVAPRLAADLGALADWLGLSDIAVSRRGDLARDLRAALA